MKISYNWLKHYLNLNLSSTEIAELLTDTGLEVEGIEEIESVKGGLRGVVIGHILTKNQHPNADRLNLTTVDIGQSEPVQIVCGAPNVDVGQKVPVATVGTWLYDGDDSFKIKKGKIRGEVSIGMICSEKELGLGNDDEGIMVLDNDAKVGIEASEHFKLDTDTVFDIGLTPNRSDAMSHIGVARDLLTVLNYKGNKLEMCRPSIDSFKVDNTSKNISVEISDSKLCPRYSGVSISGVKIASSPEWIQNKLKVIGITPTNNIVDITNYVLHEMGQPLHAFDLDKIEGNKIIVSTVKDKTKFTMLDEREIELTSQDLMINNANNPMCIAGVFGGLESGVSNETVNIFLESAYFEPVTIRKTAKRYNLNTDASFRFERGCDPNITIYALKRAALLIQEICGGKIASDIVDVYPEPIEHFNVDLSYQKMDSLIGEVIDRDIVKEILKDLEIEIINSTNDGLVLKVPPFKADVTREVDVIEEILRIYGYNTVQIPSNLSTNIPSSKNIISQDIKNIVSNFLSSNGFYETMNNSLTKAENTDLIEELDSSENVTLVNPLSRDLDVMRQTLLFGGLESMAYNKNRKNIDIKFYEFGKTYHKKEGVNIENEHLQILVSGRINSEIWNKENINVDFYYLKEIVEGILNRLGINKIKSETITNYGFSQALKYSFKNKRLVCFGKLNNSLCNHFGIKADVYAADFNWHLILELLGYKRTQYKEISKFPKVRRDLSLLIDEKISFEDLKRIALKIDNRILRSVDLFDVYEGDKLTKGKKSYALSFVFSDNEKTLKDKEVDTVMDKLIKSFNDQVGAELR